MIRKNIYNLFIGLLFVIFFWYLLHFTIDSKIIPNPLNTIINTINLLFTWGFLKHILYSSYRLITAVFLALTMGSLLGILLGVNIRLEKFLYPVIYILFPVPKAAFMPIIFVVFGLGDSSKIFLIYLILFFQIVVSVHNAVKNIPKEYYISAASLGLSKKELYKHIILPAIIPSILTSLRVCIGIGIAVLFFAETYATKFGLGYYIMNSWSLINYLNMYSGILVLSGMGFCLFSLIDVLEKKYVKWK